jgi:hypothetical protein
MSLLTQFPKYIFLKFLTEWLTVDSIVFVDTSCCNVEERRSLLLYLKTLRYIQNNSSLSPSSFPWIFDKFSELLEICSFDCKVIGNARFVSKKLHHKRKNKVAFKTCIKFARSLALVHINDEVISMMNDALKFGCVQSILCSDFHEITDTLRFKFIDGLRCVSHPKLTSVDFSYCEVLCDTMVDAMCSASRLVKINFCGCTTLTDNSTISIAEKCLDLQVLDISRNDKITEISLHALVRCSRHLTCITFGRVCQQNFTNFSDASLIRFFSHFAASLVKVGMVYVVSNAAVVSIGTHCVNITALTVRGSLIIVDSTFVALCSNCFNLTELDISDVNNLNLTTVKLILCKLTNLSNFSFGGTSAALFPFVYNLLGQKYKTVTYLDTYRDQVKGELYDIRPVLIDTVDSNYDSSVFPSSEWSEIIFQIVHKCCAIQEIHLCDDINSYTLEKLSEVTTGYSLLTSLNLRSVGGMDDACLVALSMTCFNLVTFRVVSCALISSVGVTAVCVSNSSMSDLEFDGTPDGTSDKCVICDSALINGVATLRSLKYLRLVGLPLITQAGLENTIRACIKLEKIVVLRCKKVL